MIYTVTLDPALDHIVTVSNYAEGEVDRAKAFCGDIPARRQIETIYNDLTEEQHA